MPGSCLPTHQYAGASAGHTQGPHLGEYPYTRLAEGQVLGPTTHLETEMADHYELAMAQERLTLYLPIQITVFVYGCVHCTWTLIAITWAWTGKVFMTSSDQSASYEHFHEWFPREACDAHRAEFVDMITHLGPCAWYPVQQCWGPSAVWWKDTRDKEWCSDDMVALCS